MGKGGFGMWYGFGVLLIGKALFAWEGACWLRAKVRGGVQ